MRGVAGLLVVAALGGCTSVKMVQRGGCWVRQTERKPFGASTEEVGPCAAPVTAWVDGDRLTRLVQECASRADHRWQSRALLAWNQGEALPEKLGSDDVLQQCMSESAAAVVAEGERTRAELAALREQVTALAAERDALRAREATDRAALLAANAKLADHLGDAAKKAQQPAIATATAKSEGRSTTEAAPAQPAAITVVGAPACAPGQAAAPARQARTPGKTRAPTAAPNCVPQPEPAKAAGAVPAAATGNGSLAAETPPPVK